MREAIAGKYVGSTVTRVEDKRLLVGKGRYIDDVVVPAMAHAAFVRSTVAHAMVTDIRVDAARRHPGVAAVITGAEMQEFTNPFISPFMMSGLYLPYYWPLATDQVRMVGDPIAIVIAETRAIAEDAIALIEIDYDELVAVASIADALDDSIAPIWPKAKSNVLMHKTHSYGDVEEVFAAADNVFSETFTVHRQSNQPMETRGCVADVSGDEIVFHANTQSSHMLRWILAAVTSRERGLSSLKNLRTQKDKLKALGAGAKAFVGANKDDLSGADSGGLPYLAKMDPSILRHLNRITANLLAQDLSKVPRVVADDIGGAFGVKGHPGREDAAVLAAALKLGRSIKWIEDRNEHLMVSGHAREETYRISVAVDDDGTMGGIRASLVMDNGAYPAMPFSAPTFSNIIKVMMPGAYKMAAYELDVRVTTSNKCQVVAYRGPWANETWVRERMIDVVARKLGMTPEAFRLKNLHGPADLPAKMISGPSLDTLMTARTTLETAIETFDIDAFRLEQNEARAHGRYLGVGMATYHEAAPGPADFGDAVVPGSRPLTKETIKTELADDGTVLVITSQMPNGQSHETTLSQVAADELGVALDQIKVIFGDTSRTPFSLLGTGGSRGGPMAGGATTYASRDLRRKILDAAADLLEAAVDDLDIVDGNIHVAGVPARGLTFGDVAESVRRQNSLHQQNAVAGESVQALAGTSEYDGGDVGWVQATHVAKVEVDLETGFVTILKYLVVEDCGDVINPAVVEGQVRGGVAQGVGAVFYEHAIYDQDANFQAGTFMDYLIPTSMEIPQIDIIHLETPNDLTANYRGVGEGGMIGAPATLTNAVEDALSHLGVKVREQYLPPTRVLELAGIIEPQ